jgi:hypothetical protein
MMLQKKLKSLDANTTSNQKSSTKILDVPDFLNKYGDRIVAEYLKENPAVNTLLDDPLRISDREVEGAELEDAAHKVSGRVAVLSTKMQQEFYNEISTRYNEYVEYLKQIDEYDLEVEAMNLQAETIASRTVIVGKGGQSEFGDDSVLETVMANVLRKPFSRNELENLLNESLQGKDPLAQQREIIDEYEKFIAGLLQQEIQENEKHYEDVTAEVPNEKKLKKILEKEGQAAYQSAIESRAQELQKAKKDSEEKIRKTFANRQQYLNGTFSFFYVGRNLAYPINSFDAGQELVFAVFLGFIIDKRMKNPYVPSKLRLRFAISNSNKYIAIPASYSKDVSAIIGASVNGQTKSKEDTLSRWESAIKESTVDRKARHIITGNLLQAFAAYKGKLVSYTTNDGAVKKGILMPENWNPGNEVQQKVEVPISRALKIIRSLGNGQQITTSNNISIFKQHDKFKIIVSSSKQRAGDVYLDEDILKLVDGHNFEKVSDRMTATIDESKIDDFITILQDKFNASVSLNAQQFEVIKNEIPKRTVREKPILRVEPKPRKVIEPEPAQTNELELEAMALEIELELMEFAA